MQIGNYRVLKELGAGGMGIVFKALDPYGREVAIKMIGKHADIRGTALVNRLRPQHQAFNVERRMMLVREASLAMQLKHPHIVKVLDYDRYAGLLYIVMEYLPGPSLEKIIAHRVPLSLLTRISLVTQLCQALDYAHKHEVIHRDVKPPNAVVLKGFTLKVLDFGLAGRLGAHGGRNTFAGTPPYAAPELFSSSDKYDARVDIWAAGVTFYKTLTGRLPFTGTSFAELRENILSAPFPHLDRRIPHAEELERIIGHALAKDPRQRYSSAADFVRDLRYLQEQLQKSSDATPQEPESSAESKAEDAGGTITSSTPPTSAAPPGQRVSVTSGVMLCRSADHTVRSARWCQGAFGLAFIGFPLACLYPIAYRLGFLNPQGFLGGYWFFCIAFLSYVLGVILPAALALATVFVFPAFWQQLSEVPRCRKCNLWMRYQLQELRLAGADVDWTHARDDCVAALKEDLWGDAAKLLSMRQETKAPITPSSNMRFRLDFFRCRVCGDENAVFNTEYSVGGPWKAAEEYSSAYKTTDGVAHKKLTALGERVRTFVDVLNRTFRLAVGGMHPLYMAICLIAAYFCAEFYYPQVPLIFGLPVHRAVITILTDPPGLPITVDGNPAKPPANFSWFLSSRHTIDVSGGAFPRPYGYLPGPPAVIFATDDAKRTVRSTPSPSGKGQTVNINPRVSRWGRLEPIPEVSSLTIGRPFTGARQFGPAAASSLITAVVRSSPSRLAVIVDGSSVLTPYFFSWPAGSTHTLTAPAGLQYIPQSVQDLAPGTQVYYNLGRWNPTHYGHSVPKADSSQDGQTIVVNMPSTLPGQPIVFEARFNRILKAKAEP